MDRKEELKTTHWVCQCGYGVLVSVEGENGASVSYWMPLVAFEQIKARKKEESTDKLLSYLD